MKLTSLCNNHTVTAHIFNNSVRSKSQNTIFFYFHACQTSRTINCNIGFIDKVEVRVKAVSIRNSNYHIGLIEIHSSSIIISIQSIYRNIVTSELIFCIVCGCDHRTTGSERTIGSFYMELISLDITVYSIVILVVIISIKVSSLYVASNSRTIHRKNRSIRIHIANSSTVLKDNVSSLLQGTIYSSVLTSSNVAKTICTLNVNISINSCIFDMNAYCTLSIRRINTADRTTVYSNVAGINHDVITGYNLYVVLVVTVLIVGIKAQITTVNANQSTSTQLINLRIAGHTPLLLNTNTYSNLLAFFVGIIRRAVLIHFYLRSINLKLGVENFRPIIITLAVIPLESKVNGVLIFVIMSPTAILYLIIFQNEILIAGKLEVTGKIYILRLLILIKILIGINSYPFSIRCSVTIPGANFRHIQSEIHTRIVDSTKCDIIRHTIQIILSVYRSKNNITFCISSDIHINGTTSCYFTICVIICIRALKVDTNRFCTGSILFQYQITIIIIISHNFDKRITRNLGERNIFNIIQVFTIHCLHGESVVQIGNQFNLIILITDNLVLILTRSLVYSSVVANNFLSRSGYECSRKARHDHSHSQDHRQNFSSILSHPFVLLKIFTINACMCL